MPSGVLQTRSVLAFEAFGSIDDPGANVPNVTFTLKLGSTTICTRTKSLSTATWHLSALVTVRSAGTSGSVAAALAIILNTGTADVFPFSTTVTTLNTTGSQTVDLTAAIDNYTGSEAVHCDQLLITLR